MNRQDRPDELRDRLLGDVPDARPGFWADLTERLDSVDTDANRPRLMGMNTNETTPSRPATRTRVLALAAGAALLAGAGAIALGAAGDDAQTVDVAADVESTSTSAMTESTTAAEPTTTSVPAPTTTAAGPDPAVDPSTSSTTAPEVILQRCFGFQDPDNAEFGKLRPHFWRPAFIT